MVLHKLVRRNSGEKLLVSIRYQYLHSFKERMIHLCQSILETRKISHFTWLRFVYSPFKFPMLLSQNFDYGTLELKAETFLAFFKTIFY